MMVRLIPYVLPVLFFMILTERVTLEAFLIGIVTSVLVIWVNRHTQNNTFEGKASITLYSFKLWPYWIKFILVLAREIISSNIQVAVIVLSCNMPIDPKIYQYVTPIKDERLLVLLSNSITLTPGTMTVDLKNSELTIHALTEKHYKNLFNNPLESILIRMEEILYG